MKKRRSWIVKLEEIKSYQFLYNPWTESNLVRFLIQILSHRERLIKLFDLRIISTLLLRDLRKSNPYFLVKGIVVLTLSVLTYHFNYKSSMIDRKNFYLMKLFPIHINVMELGNETSEEYFKPFTQNWLILPHLFLSFQLKRSYNQSIEHSDPINFNSGYDRNMNKKDEMISENQGPSETHSEKDEKDINSKIDSTLISTQNKYWEPEKDLCEDPFTRNKTEIEQRRERSIICSLSIKEREKIKIESDLSSKRLSEYSPISWAKELFTEDQRYTEDISFPLERKRFIENFTKSIRYSFFYILLIDESYMGSPSATEKPIEDFNLSKRLLKRQQEVFSHDLRDSKSYSLMNRIVDLWKIKTYFEIENPSSNFTISSDLGSIILKKPSYMHRSGSIKRNLTLPLNLSSAFCDQSKGQYILHKNFRSKTKKIVLEMIDQFTLSITKPSQVHDQISFYIDSHMNQLYELNKNGSLRSDRIFNHRDKLKNQSLWVLLNITDKEDEYLDQIIDKELSQIDSKNRLEIGTPLNDYRTEAFHWYESIRYNISGYSENRLNIFNFMKRSSRKLKDQIRTNWIENESFHNVTKDTIDRHSSSWRKSQREWFNRSIIRTDKNINRNLNVYNQTEYFIKYLKHVFSKQNYFQIVFDPIGPCTNTNQDSIGWSLSPNKKDYLKFSSLFESTVKILNSNFDIISKFNSKFDIFISILDFRFYELKSLNDQLLNKLLDPIGALIVHLKKLKPFLLDDHDLSKRSKLLIDEGTIKPFFSNKIPIYPLIIDLFDNEKNHMESFNNTSFSTISNDRDNWLNPIKLSDQSSLRAYFHGANTLQFFDYLHHPRSNYRKILPSYMNPFHIRRKNLTYGQLFHLLSIHNNLSSLPIGEIGPVHSEKETISFIKSQISNIFLPKYLQRKRSGDQTFVLIYDLYRSFNLLTRFNPFVRDNGCLSSIEEISITPLTKEQIVNLEKTFCQPFFHRSDSEENNLDQYLKKDFSSNMDLIQTRSYQDDLLSEIFPNKNQEMFQDWFVTESFQNIIGNKGIDGRSTLSNSSKEERNILLSPRFNEPVKKQEMYRISRIDSLFSKWDLLQTYMPWFFTSAGCKYLENMLLDNLPEILLHGSNQFVFILRDIKHNIIHKLNILWELYHPLWEPIQWKLRTNLFQFSFRFRKFILNKFFFLSPLNEFLESSTVDRKKSSVSFIWKHLRLLNARRYEEYGILIPFFVLGYSVLQYLKVTSLTFLNLKVDFELIKYLKNPSYVIELQKLMNPFVPNLWFSYIGDTSSSSSMKRKMKNRKLNSPITIIRELNKWCSSMDIYEKEIELLVQLLMMEKNISQIESNLTYSHNFLKNEFGYQITGQPGLIHLRYLAYTYQKDLMNYEFDPFCLAERWVFFAFCQKITSSQILCQTNPPFHGPPLSLHSGSLLSKGILLIGPMGTGRSYLVKSLAADSYVPLIKISLNKFLYGKYLNYPDSRIIQTEFFNLAIDKMRQFHLTLELAKRMSPCIIWIPNIHELNVNDLTHAFLDFDLSDSFLGLLVSHLSRDYDRDSIRNILVIAPTHIPQKVDPALIAPNRLDRSINIRMLVIPQRQREFPILLCSKGFYSEKELSCSDEFGSRTISSDARDLAALANEVLIISITRKKSVIDTNTIRSALFRQTCNWKSMENQVASGQTYERLIYKVGKAFIQNTLRRNSPLNHLSTKKELWKKRFCYLSEWYLEPSIAETTMKELTILPHILGCLAGSAARDSWSISERNIENCITLDRSAEHDLDLASSLLESLLVEFPWLGRFQGTFDKDQSTFAPQPKTRNHLDMIRFLQEYEFKFLQETLDAKQKETFDSKQKETLDPKQMDRDMDEEFINNIVWAPRIWRLSFLRSNRFDRTKRGTKRRIKRPNSFRSSYQFRSFKKRQMIRSKISIKYPNPMQYKSSKKPMFFLGRRFLWDPFLFQEQCLVFSRREFFTNEELLKRLYITYGSMRRTSKYGFFPKKSYYHFFRRYNSKFINNSILFMNSWKQLGKEHFEDFKRIQALSIRSERMELHYPIFAYERWLIGNKREKFYRFESLIHRQKWLGTNSLLSNESFLYNTLSESYQYLFNLFLSNRMLLDQMTRTLSENQCLFPNEIEHSIHTTGLRFDISRDNL